MAKTRFLFVAVLLTLSLTVVGCGGSGQQSAEEGLTVTIATTSPPGDWYTIGSAIANVLEKHVPNTIASVETTGGAVAIARLVETGESDLGFNSGFTTYMATRGMGPFEGEKLENIRMLLNVSPGVLHFATYADSPINSWEDIRGKKISIGARGSGIALEMEKAVLPALGMSLDDFEPQYLPQGAETVQAMQDGVIDGFILDVPYPNTTFEEISLSTPLKFIPMSEELRDSLVSSMPFFTKSSIPQGTYKGQDYEVPTVGGRTNIIVSKSLSNEKVYTILETIFDNLEEIHEVHAAAKNITLENASSLKPIEFHPGAVKFYKDRGVWQE